MARVKPCSIILLSFELKKKNSLINLKLLHSYLCCFKCWLWSDFCSQTLFNPNKTVVKMFLVTYNFGDMPVNHMTFLRHRIFLVPVEEGVEGKSEVSPGGGVLDRKKILCYLIHLRCDWALSHLRYLLPPDVLSEIVSIFCVISQHCV